MAYKCLICGVKTVAKEGDICELCAITQDPYEKKSSGVKTGRRVLLNDPLDHQQAPYVPSHTTTRKVLINGGTPEDDFQQQPTPAVSYTNSEASTQQQTPTTQKTPKTKVSRSPKLPTTAGIVKNVDFSAEKRSPLKKIYRSLFKDEPFAFNNETTSFQVFPDFSGSTLNAQGCYSDQVVVYGHVTPGAISENNDVEIYGYRNRHNVIIAKKIVNKATGAILKTDPKISPAIIWLVFAVFVALSCALIYYGGIEAVITIAIIVLCLTNLPLIVKIAMVVFRVFWYAVEKATNSR